MPQFLLVYRRSTGELLDWEELGDDRVTAARRRCDREMQEKNDPDIEVIVLGAADRAALMRTHARYFRKEIPKPAASGWS